MIRNKSYLNFILVLLLGTIGLNCRGNEKSDAYGQFEATETTISAQLAGTLLKFRVDEGEQLKKGRRVGLIDTTQLVLKKQQLQAKLKSVQSKTASVNAKVAVQKEELELAETNLERTQALIQGQAATQQQLDQSRAKVQTIQKQIDALQTQKKAIHANMAAIKAQINQVEAQLQDARIVNPINGTVLTTYVKRYEVVRQGQPLYKIAALDTMILRVYVSGAQLPQVKLGQQVEVLIDKNASENHSLAGTVKWVASEAEFTPQQIQTKEERVTQVYAVKVCVANPNDIIKVGMPGEVNF
ncbi:MAG TPA: HlyD family efflux transporter periplasmic adaptor subunit [Balneolaceae bacterium]|nr:HlyD family efflux transporter periplasmic adaptor subunit [Balneolaceae bacterium]